MAQTYKLLNIDVNEDVHDIITAKQGDANSRFLDVKLTDNGVSVDLTAHDIYVNMLKPDGRRIWNRCEITDATAGRFQAELTNQALAIPGRELQLEFVLYGDDGQQILTTKTFNIVVLKNLFDEEAVESTNEFGAVVTLFQDVFEVRNTINSISDRIGWPDDPAGTQTVFGDLQTLIDTTLELNDRIPASGLGLGLKRTKPFGGSLLVGEEFSLVGAGYLTVLLYEGSGALVNVYVDGNEGTTIYGYGYNQGANNMFPVVSTPISVFIVFKESLRITAYAYGVSDNRFSFDFGGSVEF